MSHPAGLMQCGHRTFWAFCNSGVSIRKTSQHTLHSPHLRDGTRSSLVASAPLASLERSLMTMPTGLVRSENAVRRLSCVEAQFVDGRSRDPHLPGHVSRAHLRQQLLDLRAIDARWPALVFARSLRLGDALALTL